ncbi:MAG: hypothetical protein AAF202_08770, partial [Pseudomonadota bacterium]
LSSVAQAEDTQSPVLDLGNIEIEGEVRRPPVQSFNASHLFDSGKSKVLSGELSSLELGLLNAKTEQELAQLRARALKSLEAIQQQALNAERSNAEGSNTEDNGDK